MKKNINKIMQLIMLICMIFSSIQTPLVVLADAINTIDSQSPQKGDIKLGESGEISSSGTVSVTATNSKTGEGAVSVTKTVSKVDDNGKYHVTFNIVGEGYSTSTSTTLPSYTVFVLDASGSMKGTRWNNAKNAAISFSQKLIEAGEYVEDGVTKNTNNIALVTFAGSLVVSKDFSQTAFTNSDLGSTQTGTDYQAGFDKAYEYLNALSTEVKESSSLNVIFISDGQPNEGNCTSVSTCNTSLAALKNLGDGVNVYTFAYELYGTTATNLLKSISTNNKVESVTSDNIDSVLAGFVETVSGSTPAGETSSFEDGIGDSFKVVGTGSSYDFGESYLNNSKTSIDEEGIKISFDIQIDSEVETGWHNTNDGFKLVYKDSATGVVETIECSEDPYVYWESYRYQVNYYKDSIADTNKLASEVRVVSKDTIINESNVNKDKYLTKAGVGYEFKQINPEEIVVNNPLEIPVINVLYTLKEYTYDVEYYYDSELDSKLDNIGPVSYGTEVDPSDYYLKVEDIRLGYKLDTNNTNSDSILIDSENEVIKIYYIKDNFEYTVNYHFGENETIDNTDTNNKGTAEFGSVINPEDKYLSQEKLTNKGYEGYFINPTKPHLPSGGLTIGADPSKNIIDIYYINTEVLNETTTKNANKSIISSSSELIEYTVNYQANINNLRAGDVVVVTIIDTLPKKIDESKSNLLNGGVYNKENNTITWTYTINISEFTESYVVNKEVVYTVNYLDFANMSSNVNNLLLNTVKGMVTINNDTSLGAEGEEEVEVAIDGTLIVEHVDTLGNELVPSVVTNNKVGTSYSEVKKDIYGYTIKTEPDNKNGNYIEGTITVTFIYSKNDGSVVDNKVEKDGPATIDSVNGTFNYTLDYYAEVKDYVGKVTLTITDILPKNIDLEKSTFDNRCEYTNNELVCTETIEINEEFTKVDESFELSLVFKDITEEKIINKVTATLTYGDNEVENKDEVETQVLKGTVIATYKDDKGNVLADEVSSTDLADKEYKTEELEFLGYTLTEIPENESGKYVANETIYVEYIYSKNVGTSEEELVKTGQEEVKGIDKPFEYTITYNTEIFDYVGAVDIEIIDTPEHEIDLEKSVIGNNCSFIDGKIVCKYNINIIDKNDSIINIKENLILYYKNITDAIVNNQANATLTYGTSIKTTDSSCDTLVASGNVIVNYVTDNGTKLTDSITTSDLIGREYKTNEKAFDGYYLKEVQGEEEGLYQEETINVTYVYSTIPLPPQTGINNNAIIYLNIIIGMICLFVFKKRI